jgi:hypothetical protein
MSDNAAIVILVLTLSLAFCGEPDLHDALISNLYSTCESQ